MRKAKKGIVLVAVLILASSTAMANGLNLNGFGARAAAMGGAFVGLADDYTAVFWNPAGLALLGEKTFGLAADAILPYADYALGPFSMKTKSKIYPAGLLGYFHPVSDNMIVGVGVYTPSGLGAHWESTGFEQVIIDPLTSDDFFPPVESYNWESFIGAITIAPSIAFKLSDYVMVGATFNINYGFFQMDRWGGYQGTYPSLINLGQQSFDVKGWGFGATFGVLVKPSDMVSFGATCRIPSKMKLSGTVGMENVDILGLPTESDVDMDVTYPLWLAGGIAVKPVANLTLTFDAQYTNWKELDELPLTFADPLWDLAIPEEMRALFLYWEDKVQLRGGAELVFGDFAIRGGYYYDPTPTPDTTLNVLVPGFDFNNITFGVGYNKGNLNLDFGFEYLMGKKREIALDPDNAMPGTYEMYVLVPQVSLSFGW